MECHDIGLVFDSILLRLFTCVSKFQAEKITITNGFNDVKETFDKREFAKCRKSWREMNFWSPLVFDQTPF